MKYMILILLLSMWAVPVHAMTFLEQENRVEFPIENNALVPHTFFDTKTPINALYGLLEDEFPAHAVENMYRIALCESGGMQDKNGKVVTSDTGDHGVLQINHYYWDKTAEKLGLDYKTSIRDNVKMARIVYDQQGYEGWTCWSIIQVL